MRRNRPLIWVLAAVVVVALVAGGGLIWRQQQSKAADDAARQAAAAVAAAIAKNDVSGLAFAGTDGAAAQKAYTAATGTLATLPTSATVKSVTRQGDSARAVLAVTRTLGGDVKWSYELPLSLEHDSAWRVPASQQLVHPDLKDGEKLRLRRTDTPRADILGGDGKALVSLGDVVDVGIQPSRIQGPVAQTVAKIAGIVGVDAAPLAKRVQAADPKAFVDVITLRRSDYNAVRDKLRPIPGAVFRERQQSLAPTREFARALIGTVGPVTGDIVKQSKGRYVAGDVAGLSGLQRQYDEQLSGTPGVTVEAMPVDNSAEPRTLFSKDAVPGKPLKLTLRRDVQEAADLALQGLSQPSALVAVDVRTGAVLAVANSPATGLNRAMVGKYPPGSTFKIVTTLALLEKGLKPSDTVPCPPTATVSGRTFKNYESEKFGPVPFHVDFAKSCNTAFVGLSKRLGDDDLATAAKSLGIGAKWDLGTSAFSGSVPVNSSDVDKAAASFGQGRTEVSPLAMTVATASVARGGFLAPSLVLDGTQAAAQPQALPGSAVQTLQSLMREVVTGGTGDALKSVPGGPVHAKTGTAEFGTDVPPKTRAWITGWQGDIAFTAFVEEGKSGGTVAGPVAARFLRALNG
ncbi:MAG: penicillin-binding transpeptidase domain-containing protein [Angustibacter sp.]